jgi:hypothetical protein
MWNGLIYETDVEVDAEEFLPQHSRLIGQDDQFCRHCSTLLE